MDLQGVREVSRVDNKQEGPEDRALWDNRHPFSFCHYLNRFLTSYSVCTGYLKGYLDKSQRFVGHFMKVI